MKTLLLSLLVPFSVYGSLHPSVLMFNGWDIDSCQSQVEKAIHKLNPKGIQIMPTLHFIAKGKNKMNNFCLQKESCFPLTPARVESFQKKLISCLNFALKNNLEVLYTPHLDSSGKNYVWRNSLIFDPLLKNEGYSYYDLFIGPLLKCENQKNIILSMQGEMGATIFSYPEKYRQIVEKLKQDSPSMKVGISFNYNKITGGYGPSTKNLNDMKDLISSVDFVGLSAYAPIKVRLKRKHFRRSLKQLVSSLSTYNLSLPVKKPVYYIEVGLGGGSYKNNGKSKAKNPRQAAKNPYAGIWDLSNPNNHPWKSNKMKNYRFLYHKKLMEFINQQNNHAKSIKNPVIKAYLWNANSWDPFGLYQNNEVYQDQQIIDYYKSYYE